MPEKVKKDPCPVCGKAYLTRRPYGRSSDRKGRAWYGHKADPRGWLAENGCYSTVQQEQERAYSS